jgi:hypothetical protein
MDGACFFTAISHQLFCRDVVMDSAELRQRTVALARQYQNKIFMVT